MDETSQNMVGERGVVTSVNESESMFQGKNEEIRASKKSQIRKREIWSKKIDFLFACIGFCVGLGNVWRFPYLCYRNGGAYNKTQYPKVENATIYQNKTLAITDPSTEFWERRVLGLSDGIGDPKTIEWDIALCLLLAWLVVYLCICKGIKSSGKVMYFTASSPYVLIIVLLIRSATLDGAQEGFLYYLTPKLWKLKEAKVWVDAGAQVFYSNAVGIGSLYALGSYNKFNHNSLRDVAIFSCVNGCTSILAGSVIFTTLGFMAKKQHLSIDDVAESGPGLIFVVYPEALSQMPAAPVWSVLFFCMIFLVGLDSQFVGVEGLIASLVDMFPRQLRVGHRKEVFIACICSLSFLVGLTMVTHGMLYISLATALIKIHFGRKGSTNHICHIMGGVYVFQIFDFYVMGRILFIMGFLECMVLSYIYGVGRFLDNIQMMIGFRPSNYLKICWCVLTPGFTMVLFIVGALNYSEVIYQRRLFTYHYPAWIIGVGWSLTLCCFLCVPGCIVVKLLCEKGRLVQKLKEAVKPHLKSFRYEKKKTCRKYDLTR